MTFVSTGGSTARAYDVAYTVLIGAILVVVLPFAIIALAKNKYGRDPARRFVPWLKAAFVLFTITLCLLFVQGVLNTYEIHSDVSHWHIVRASYHVGYLAEFFRTVSAAAVMVFLLELGPGMHYAIEGVSSMFDKIIRYTAYVLAAVITALAIAYYGLSADFQVNYTNHIGNVYNSRDALDRIYTINQLMGTTAVILWVASLVITGLSIYTFIQRKMSPLKSASTLYLVASLLNLLSSTWNFAYAIEWLFGWEWLGGRAYYVLILSIILGWWSRGILLVVSYFVALKSGPRGGVWSHVSKNDYGNRV
ncbi:hypothetical protein DL764_007087 [Monosporascus ibericus]|uniref:Uncharacterized protein n=1 Tax=Monosporascus ibericus TaxID=155417 RepID=A0A4Q4T333_9PEZI|nr:hypothetical protein DL764_007087 [Monosporascus ibericus]